MLREEKPQGLLLDGTITGTHADDGKDEPSEFLGNKTLLTK